MAETPTSFAGTLRAKLTALFTSFVGLISGAALMYVSPLVDHFVKPGVPTANFSVDKDGWTVTVHNQSSGGHEGWWDFGDGSALEAFDPNQTALTHKYAAAGQYPIKLSLKSVFGEAHDRTVSVQLADTAAAAPKIAAFDVAPLHKHVVAPATFRVIGQAANAEACVWSYGDRDPEVQRDTSGPSERLVTFAQPGTYTVKLIALAGKKAAEASKTVVVQQRTQGEVVVQLNVTDELTQVKRVSPIRPVHIDFPPQANGNTFSFERVLHASHGYQIVDKKILDDGTAQGVQGLRVEVLPEKQAVKLTGQLVRQTKIFGKTQQLPHATVKVQLFEEQQLATPPTPTTVAGPLAVPGTTLLDLPRTPTNATVKKRTTTLDVIQGNQRLLQGADLPHGRVLTLNNHTYQLNAAIVGNQVHVDVTDPQSGVRPAGFQAPAGKR
jgi:PKD repeat protein